MGKDANRKRDAKEDKQQKRTLFNRIKDPLALLLAVITCLVLLRQFYNQESVPGYLETNGGVVIRMTPNGLGSVRQSTNIASAERIKKTLPKQAGKVRVTASDEQLVEEAERQFKLGEHQQARVAYEQLERKFPESADIRLNLNVTLQLLGDLEGAAHVIEEIRLASTDTTSATAIALLANLLQTYVGASDSTRARELLASPVVRNAKDPVIANAEGVMAYSQGHFSEAVEAFEKASNYSKGLPLHEVNEAVALFDGGETRQAKARLDSLDAQAEQSADTQALLGRYYLSEGEVELAQQAMARARAMQPGRADINYNSAYAFASTDSDSTRFYFELAGVQAPELRALPLPRQPRPPIVLPTSTETLATGDDAQGTPPSPGRPPEHSAPSGEPGAPPTTSGTGVGPASSGPDRPRVSGIQLRINVVPRTGGPAAKVFWGEGRAVFGSVEQAMAYRPCALTYLASIDASGQVQSTRLINSTASNRTFESSVQEWLTSNALMASNAPYEARIEATVVVVD